eukprot:387421-Pyramimonas_sp.AAC.1
MDRPPSPQEINSGGTPTRSYSDEAFGKPAGNLRRWEGKTEVSLKNVEYTPQDVGQMCWKADASHRDSNGHQSYSQELRKELPPHSSANAKQSKTRLKERRHNIEFDLVETVSRSS